ncbi:serine O-acetyltransferase [Celerinatantimonas diazotrophica]|uniref:Serine acetyltransferase n=1 Tax=Celerinatantimonas diazotrophica TaxID=412034 RepID=A0A4R1J8A7_9GAMM|nr:serine O-acetyltransferase [Celerinatantimonas diazotrophica]TCK46792.1 serine O-acetyltransferase [Celerinatantimonas diazotrophica]CAG9295495.1 Serine acetyltransferase [Celerinatantimonas diazotrophica]
MILTRQQVWEQIVIEARELTVDEPMLGSFFHATILNHKSLRSALSFQLASKLDSTTVQSIVLREIIEEAFRSETDILDAAAADIVAVVDRDPAVAHYAIPLLYLKGFHALQGYRVAHWLWKNNRQSLASYLQNQISVVFGVDVHPAAQIGRSIMLDHATGIVVGETAIVEDEVSILQSVTLGGTGKESGDRHPKIRRGVLIGAGAKILGNIEVGRGAKVGAGSVVLQDVPEHTTVAGVPAKIVGRPECDSPASTMSQSI